MSFRRSVAKERWSDSVAADGAMSVVSLVGKRDATVSIRFGSVDSPLVGERKDCLVEAVVGQQGQTATTILRR